MIKMHVEAHFHHPGPLNVLLQSVKPDQATQILFNASLRYDK